MAEDPGPRPRVAVIVPTLNRPAPVLLRALDSILDQRDPAEEVWIIDQTSPPDPKIVAYARGHGLAMRHVAHPVRGLPNARNVGAGLTKAEILLYADDDVIAGPDWVGAHRAAHADPSVGAVVGRVFERVRGQRPAKDLTAAIPGPVGRFRPCDADFVDRFDSTEPADVDSLFGCNMSIRADALRAAGGFCTLYGGTAHLEETDLALRLRALGWRIRFEPRAELEHCRAPEGGCRVRSRRTWVYWYGHNYGLLFARHFRWACLPVFLAERIARCVKFGWETGDPGVGIAGLRGLWDAAGTYRRAGRTPFSWLRSGPRGRAPA